MPKRISLLIVVLALFSLSCNRLDQKKAKEQNDKNKIGKDVDKPAIDSLEALIAYAATNKKITFGSGKAFEYHRSDLTKITYHLTKNKGCYHEAMVYIPTKISQNKRTTGDYKLKFHLERHLRNDVYHWKIVEKDEKKLEQSKRIFPNLY